VNFCPHSEKEVDMAIDTGNALGNPQPTEAGASYPASKRTKNALDKAQVGHLGKHNLGHTNPEGGSDNREAKGSQSGGAGSGIPTRENPKSKTPDKNVQAARARHAARENGSQDTTGKR
jgi:hypothetical protein